VGAACAVFPAGDWSMVAVDSPTARRRLVVAMAGPDALVRAAPTLIAVCARISAERSEEATQLSAGAVIRGLAVALHAQGVGWSWDPNRPFDADASRAALALGERWRPLGIVAVGPMPEGGASRPRPPVDPARSLDRRG
jgi:nitroreductase